MEAAIAPKPVADGLCAAGLTARDIRDHREDVYGLQVSPDLPLIAASGGLPGSGSAA
ncbi:hypothetical protein [Oceaniovalibus sp. ACAM 378]|uniref:hypothetical protein n=1 Tax=Oceaniovalibus sp. ACAM 378 TaxID=2599923 RepID=UPI0021082649|nr:hypothetical protein [Oceaniovalibus sp. ACAM 378]